MMFLSDEVLRNLVSVRIISPTYTHLEPSKVIVRYKSKFLFFNITRKIVGKYMFREAQVVVEKIESDYKKYLERIKDVLQTKIIKDAESYNKEIDKIKPKSNLELFS